MTWKADFKNEENFIEVSYKGDISQKDLFDAFYAVYGLVTENNTAKILADCTEMKAGHTLFDLFSLIERVKMEDMAYAIKEALVIKPEQIENGNISFWETACKNRGLNVKIFEEREKALEWLIK